MKSTRKIISVFIMTIMSLQIILGFVWMIMNITSIPGFGDSTEYLNLSQTLVLDEYRPILYPLILRWILRFSEFIHIPYQVLLYPLQTILSFASIFYMINILNCYVDFGLNPVKKIFISLFFLTIPMITFMNFTVLTDSFANSVLILLLTNLVHVCLKTEIPVKTYIIIIATLIAGSLLRADRVYSCLFVVAVIFLGRILKNKVDRKNVLTAMLLICFIVIAVVKGVGHFTQTPGINGRIQTNFDFVLLDRVVWPNMHTHYKYFPDNIKEIITYDDAATFDSHNNNVMYQMAPLVEEKVGKDKAGQVYRKMASIVLKHSSGKVLKDTGEDMLIMIATPISSLLHYYGKVDKNDSWNLHCMSGKTPKLTELYNLYSLYLFLVLLFVGIVLNIKKQQLQAFQQYVRILVPYMVMSVVLTLWFCIGDGAPPNDRYALIIYMLWDMLALGSYGVWTVAHSSDRI